jgi:hypothetical protein
MRSLNFFIRRVRDYNPSGRNQSAEESDEIGVELCQMLDDLGVVYEVIDGDDHAAATITERALDALR